ncbi:MAG: NnrS family protein [Gammaproteobacteria bacterium]|nr:NnrS family protein [Gammaproteobacteria bacterium]
MTDNSTQATRRLKPDWQSLAAAPHRMFFATGIGFILLVAAWWLLIMLARSFAGGVLEPVVPALITHGSLMLYVVFTPFMFGFLLTVYPRWQVAPDIPLSVQMLALSSLHVGLMLLLAGSYLSMPLAAAGWLVLAVGWLAMVGGFAWSWWQCEAPVIHAGIVWLGMCCGLLGAAGMGVMLLAGDYSWWPWLKAMGLWGFLLIVFIGVCHRMIPFFTSRVVPGYEIWRPDSLLRLFVAAALLRVAVEPLAGLHWLPDATLFGLSLAFAWRWRPGKRHGNALLRVLHVSMAWLVIATGFYFLDSSLVLVDSGFSLGRAPLHAMSLGFLGSMLLAMVTRVTMGHSGRPLALDRKGWWIFLLLQLTTITRLVAELRTGWASDLLQLAAAGWLLVFLLWAWRYAWIYFVPRADGQPG